MKRGIRKKDHEDLSDAKIEEVIALLSGTKPITKKAACDILNISYNTSRLQKIIDEYVEQKDHEARRRKELRSQPLSKDEIVTIISSYLESGNISEIESITFRSASVIKKVLAKYNIPLRSTSVTYQKPLEIDENSISENYNKNDLVYSSRYDQVAYISKLIKRDALGDIYRLWLIKDCQYAYQPFYELADLRKLQTELGIEIHTRKMWEVNKHGDDPLQLDINQAMQNAKKRKKDIDEN
jgi:hypothetical protein